MDSQEDSPMITPPVSPSRTGGHPMSPSRIQCKIYESSSYSTVDCDAVRAIRSFPKHLQYIRFFGYPCLRKSMFEESSLEHNFNLFKYHLQPFSTMSSCQTHDQLQIQTSSDYVMSFLDFIQDEVALNRSRTISEVQSLLVQLIRCLQYAGRVHEGALDINKRSFHILLKLWLTAWKIAQIPDVCIEAVSLTHLLFWDLIIAYRDSRAPCGCLRKTLIDITSRRTAFFWDDLIKTEEHEVSIGDEEWTLFGQGFTDFGSNFQLEMIATLLQADVQLPPNAAYCRLLLLSSLGSSTETTVANAKVLIAFWPQHAMELFLPILDHFLLNIDASSDKRASSGIGALTENDFSARFFTNTLDTLTSASHSRQGSPFLECLSLAANILRESNKNALRQITGRVYLKVSRAKVLTFSNRGLSNFTLLMLLLTRFSETPFDIIKRFKDIAIPGRDVTLTTAKIKLLCASQASFQILLNLMEKPIDLKPVLNFALERFKQEVKVHTGEVIPTLLEILEELAAARAFDRGLVFDSQLAELFERSAPSLQVSILGCCGEIVDLFSGLDPSESTTAARTEFAKSTTTVGLPMVCSLLKRLEKFSSGYELNCAADFSSKILACLTKRDGGTDHVTLFNDLIASQMSVQPVFVARLLARLGDTDQTAFRKFWSEMDQSDVVLLKLFMLVRTPNEDMDSLSRTVFDMKACSSEAQMEIFFLRGGLEKSDSMQCYQRTVRSWAKRLEILMRSDQIQQAVLFRKKVRAVLSSVRFEAKAVAELPSGQISHLYKTVSLLFSEAPELLYTKGLADCPLPQLLEVFVHPKALIREGKTAIPRAQIEGMRTQGHLFLIGLAKLHRGDALISRKFSEVVSYYCKQFPQATPISSYFVLISRESEAFTKAMADALWNLELDRSAIIEILFNVVKRCSESLSTPQEIRNFHLVLCVKFLSSYESVLLSKFRLLLESCLTPCGIHLANETASITPVLETLLRRLDSNRIVQLLDSIAMAWPELAAKAFGSQRLEHLCSSSSDLRTRLEKIKEKLRIMSVRGGDPAE